MWKFPTNSSWLSTLWHTLVLLGFGGVWRAALTQAWLLTSRCIPERFKSQNQGGGHCAVRIAYDHCHELLFQFGHYCRV